jgi:primosomal protein N' (replication factor Y)
MEQTGKYADVILPLAAIHPLTYTLPENVVVKRGMRVVVPLGASKLYTGIVCRIHNEPPEHYKTKAIETVLDDEPVVTELQLTFWKWLSDYYMCSMGEVMNAALPASLRLSSETIFVPNQNIHEIPEDLSFDAERLLLLLKDQGKINIELARKFLEVQNVHPILKELLDRKLINSEEEVKEKFKRVKKKLLMLSENYRDENVLKTLFDQLEKSNSYKQTEVLMIFLQLSNWDDQKGKPVSKKEITNKITNSSNAVSALVEKGILIEMAEDESNKTAKESFSLPELAQAQYQAYQAIQEEWIKHDVVLLHGVTSSGKTAVYMHLIEEHLKREEDVLFLLPEIALTSQIVQRLEAVFPGRVSVFHSGYGDRVRTDVWIRQLEAHKHKAQVIIGARSAIFLPFQTLGLIIVDEEHDPSFKQQDPAPRYHARDAAIKMGTMHSAKILLGSATPSIESNYSANTNKFGLVALSERFGNVELPQILFADLRNETKHKVIKGNFSSTLIQQIESTLKNRKQVILFQNRRGYAPVWQCHHCGWTPECIRCDISLTYHKHVHQLKCHLCGYLANPPAVCLACGHHDLRMLGLGTEKLEEEVQELFPDAVVERMDLDTAKSRAGYQKIIMALQEQKIDILVGTQMITKGLDFENVGLVGIMSADKMMHYPDFRSIERSFQMMLQVAGRSGRKGDQGIVVIQTWSPDHWLLQLISKHDYKTFYDHEVRERYQFQYPPFLRLIRITIKHKNEITTSEAAIELGKLLKDHFGDLMLGPEKPTVARVNNYYLQQILLKIEKNHAIHEKKILIADAIRKVLQRKEFRSCRVIADVDPV